MNPHDFSQRQYEVHLTAPIDKAPPVPDGFYETRIVNRTREGQIVQTYILHTCRFAGRTEIPWELESRYQRFKVEQKILKAYPREGKLLLNENYFRELPACEGLEIHIQTDELFTDMLPSAVDDAKHQTIFVETTNAVSLKDALELVERYGRLASKLYLEAVIYDNNPAMDKDWESACH